MQKNNEILENCVLFHLEKVLEKIDRIRGYIPIFDRGILIAQEQHLHLAIDCIKGLIAVSEEENNTNNKEDIV